MAQGGSKFAVLAAIVGNTVVMVSKFSVYFITGSGAILSEAIHSVADLFNQVLLYVGIRRSAKEPDQAFDYGYGAEQYVWALMSAVGIFFLGCGLSLYHGIDNLMDPRPLQSLGWAVGVLVFAFVVEFAILWVAVQAVRKSAGSTPFFEYLRKQADPAAAAVILEDAAACVGVVIALVAILLIRLTGNLYWDAIASILIGFLLGAVAIWLIARNHGLLVGPSIPAKIRAQILRIIHENPAVEEVVDLRTRVLDTETYRIRANIRFDGAALAEKLDERLKAAYEDIKTFDDFQKFTVEYADELIELLADEIDAIERDIRVRVPRAQHLDIEAD